MPTIIVNWLEGRTDEIKRNVARDITKVVSQDAGVPESVVTIMFNDLPKTNFAQGGTLAADK